MKSTISEIRRHFEKAKAASARVETALLAGDLRDDWELFLNEFNKCIGKLITAAKQSSETRAFGHLLRNSSQKDDPALVFLREARNKDEHGLEPSAKYADGSTELFGGFMALGPNCTNITISNCSINGTKVREVRVDTDMFGRICSLHTSDPIKASYRSASITLVPIYSEEKRKTFQVPQSFWGHDIEKPTPSVISKLALEFLDEKLCEFESLNA